MTQAMKVGPLRPVREIVSMTMLSSGRAGQDKLNRTGFMFEEDPALGKRAE